MTAAPFLEREDQFAVLRHALDAALNGTGNLILLSGEAGVGKTSFVRRFAATLTGVSVVTGACDPLPTPPALGPLVDIAPRVQAGLQELLDGNRSGSVLYPAVFAALDVLPAPLAMVFEDVHWADQATIELISYLGRRIERLRLLLIVTFRPEEISSLPGGLLALMLGDLATAPAVTRLTLDPLSRAATTLLAEAGQADGDELFRITGGNPFFVTEVLSARSRDLPATVRDAVLARVARLSPEARQAVEVAAAIGVRMDPRVLVNVMQASGTPRWSMQEAINAGVLEQQGLTLAFRHELAQAAIASATAPERAERLHATILAELRGRTTGPDDYAILTRHAELAGDDRTVLDLAPLAAEHAAALGAHREAADLYGKALERARDQPLAVSRLLERRGAQHYASRQFINAMSDHRAAAHLCRELGDLLGQARNLIRTAYLGLARGERTESEATLSAATLLLEQLPPSHELAAAYEAWSRRLFVSNDPRSAAAWAQRAMALAERLDDRELSLEAGVTAAVSELQLGDDTARTRLQELRDVARQRSLTDLWAVDTFARVTFYLAFVPMLHRSYANVDEYIDDGWKYAQDHDLGYWQSMLAGVQVLRSMDTGRWHNVTAQAQRILESSDPAWRSRLLALICLARVKARTGQSDAIAYLEQATQLADHDPAVAGMLMPVRAEADFLGGANPRCLPEATGDPWFDGEVAFWAHLAGRATDAKASIAEPYRLAILGNWACAAHFWAERGCPYEEAVTLATGDDPAAVRRAIAVLDQLGAVPAADFARHRLRALGITVVPRGPRRSTSANPAGLTRREQEVLALVAARHTNVEIAARLFISEKTVERHLAGIFARLNVNSRREAAQTAMRLGALPSDPT